MITILLLSAFFEIFDSLILHFLPAMDQNVLDSLNTVYDHFYNIIHTVYYYYLPHVYLNTWLPRLFTICLAIIFLRIVIWVFKH